MRNKALSYEMPNLEITQYQQNQHKFSQREFHNSDMQELLTTVENSQIVYIGDFHTFDQNIRNVLRLIRFIVGKKRKLVIGLEMVDHEHQLKLDSFMQGHITELEFLEEINYHDSWRFPWIHYQLIFDLAKEHHIPIVGLNKRGTLQQRDSYASDLIKELIDSDTQLIVLYGELHITPNKIPALTRSKCPNVSQLIIHQNLDEVYWKLTDSKQHTEVIKFQDNEFCLITAPPWIKYESMVYWYENLCDDPEFDLHNYIIENGKKIFSDDTKENFFQISFQIINYLKLNISEDELEDFNLYDHTNLDYVEKLLEESFDENAIHFYQYLIATNRSFRFLGSKFYCSSYSLNRISYLAGIHILHFYLAKLNLNTHSIYHNKNSQKHLTLMTLEAMSAYFFSKVINPHRKCEMFKDLQLKSKLASQTQKNIISLSISLMNERNTTFNLDSFTLAELYEVSLNVGHILGEYLYLMMTKKGSEFRLESYLSQLNFNFLDFLNMRDDILRQFDYRNHQKRYF